MPRRRADAGVTLLEAVVALAIFASAGMALYALFNANLLSMNRAQSVAAQLPAAYRAIEYLAAIDPREQPTGRADVGGYEVVWSAQLLEPVRDSQDSTGFRGYHEIGLYEVSFALHRDGRPFGAYTLRVPSHRQVRFPVLD